MINKSNLILILIFLISLGSASLSVYNAQSLGVPQDQLRNISYNIANYGFIPKGKTLLGKLMIINDSCSFENNTDHYQKSFLLIPRGQCTFVSKTLIAQKLGAQLTIIEDNKLQQQLVTMQDDGYGYKAKIPTIVIHKNDGELLRDLIMQNQNITVMMTMNFQQKKVDVVKVKFWLQANRRQSYHLVEKFQKFYEPIKNHIKFTIGYPVSSCPICKIQDCFYKNKYCYSNFIHDQVSTGQHILKQQLRQTIIFQNYFSVWWNYMKYIDDQCVDIPSIQQCQAQFLKQNSIDPHSIQRRVDQQLSQKTNSVTYDKYLQQLQKSGVLTFPSVVLNNERINGNLHAQFVFDDICNLLKSPPKECNRYINQTQYEQRQPSQWGLLVLIIAVGVSIFSLIFCLYKRHLKRSISNDMQGRVDDMVSKYIQFYSQRNK